MPRKASRSKKSTGGRRRGKKANTSPSRRKKATTSRSNRSKYLVAGVLLLAAFAIYLGYLSGAGASREPGVKDDARMQAIARVSELYRGFIRQFGDTDCKALTGVDWSKKEDAERFYRDKVNLTTCGRQFDHVLTALLPYR